MHVLGDCPGCEDLLFVSETLNRIGQSPHLAAHGGQPPLQRPAFRMLGLDLGPGRAQCRQNRTKPRKVEAFHARHRPAFGGCGPRQAKRTSQSVRKTDMFSVGHGDLFAIYIFERSSPLQRRQRLALATRALIALALGIGGVEIGGAEEDRTPDLRIANASLSQLSYGPTSLRRRIM